MDNYTKDFLKRESTNETISKEARNNLSTEMRLGYEYGFVAGRKSLADILLSFDAVSKQDEMTVGDIEDVVSQVVRKVLENLDKNNSGWNYNRNRDVFDTALRTASLLTIKSLCDSGFLIIAPDVSITDITE